MEVSKRQGGEDPEEYSNQFLVKEWAEYFVGKTDAGLNKIEGGELEVFEMGGAE